MMKLIFAYLVLLISVQASAQSSPQIAHLESAQVDDTGWKVVVVRSERARYILACDTKQKSCITPEPATKYYVVEKTTRFVIPGAKDPITLAFVEDFFGSYPSGETIALWSVANPPGFVPGIYLLRSVRALTR